MGAEAEPSAKLTLPNGDEVMPIIAETERGTQHRGALVPHQMRYSVSVHYTSGRWQRGGWHRWDRPPVLAMRAVRTVGM